MSKRILSIDDDEAIRKSFILAFEGTEYKIDTAESGHEALEKIKTNLYDLLFLDLKMPEMDGVEALRKIRKISKKIPVFILTAFHKEFFSNLKLASEEGLVFELLEKPVGVDEIILIVKSVLEGPQAY
ncbi:MAG: response regulator [Candidatus Melainabacteria bacterium]|nr:response regulator [Candidatus Melainabacteria bacterium]